MDEGSQASQKAQCMCERGLLVKIAMGNESSNSKCLQACPRTRSLRKDDGDVDDRHDSGDEPQTVHV